MNEATRDAALTIGRALKPDFAEMDEVFHKYLLPALGQVVAEKVALMSPDDIKQKEEN